MQFPATCHCTTFVGKIGARMPGRAQSIPQEYSQDFSDAVLVCDFFHARKVMRWLEPAAPGMGPTR